jgi:phosphorylcholine metabolism protein LicD
MENCFRLIEQYQTEISLIHFPLQLTNNTIRRKQPLFKKRSQSEWCIESLEEQSKHKFRHSDDQLNNIYHYKDNSSVTSSPLKYRDSIETIQQKLSAENERQQPPLYQRSGGYSKIKNDNQKRSSRDEYTSEDEIYEDVDKIYDYIRSGDITRDVQKIQAKEHVFEGTSSPTMSVS